jgi:hypothetical protein
MGEHWSTRSRNSFRLNSESSSTSASVVPSVLISVSADIKASSGFWFGDCVMSLQYPYPRKRIEDIRCPAVKGVPNDIYHILHHSFVEILKMRRSIESADALIDKSMKTVAETLDVLDRLRNDQRAHQKLPSEAMPLHPEA